MTEPRPETVAIRIDAGRFHSRLCGDISRRGYARDRKCVYVVGSREPGGLGSGQAMFFARKNYILRFHSGTWATFFF